MKVQLAQNLSSLSQAVRRPRVARKNTPQQLQETSRESLSVSEPLQSLPFENLRPGDQHETGLRGALNAIGGFLGVALTKAMRGMKAPMMTGAWKDLLVASYEVPKEALQVVHGRERDILPPVDRRLVVGKEQGHPHILARVA